MVKCRVRSDVVRQATGGTQRTAGHGQNCATASRTPGRVPADSGARNSQRDSQRPLLFLISSQSRGCKCCRQVGVILIPAAVQMLGQTPVCILRCRRRLLLCVNIRRMLRICNCLQCSRQGCSLCACQRMMQVDEIFNEIITSDHSVLGWNGGLHIHVQSFTAAHACSADWLHDDERHKKIQVCTCTALCS